MFKLKVNKLSAGLFCGLMMTASAQAGLLITNWSADVTAQWIVGSGNPLLDPSFEGDFGGDSLGTPAQSSSVLSWGATGGSYTPIGGSRSALEITNGSLPGLGIMTNAAAPTATSTITHYNNELAGGTNSLLSATIFTRLTLTPTAPAGPARGPLEATVPIQFIETPNSNCVSSSMSVCDDIFILAAGDLSDTFEIDGFIYTARITAIGLGGLDDETCLAAGGAVGCFGLTTPENEATPIQFFVGITGREIPVSAPATLALLGLGLMGLSRRAKAKRG